MLLSSAQHQYQKIIAALSGKLACHVGGSRSNFKIAQKYLMQITSLRQRLFSWVRCNRTDKRVLMGFPIDHLHNGVILLLRPESFSFFFSYLNFVIPARFKWQKSRHLHKKGKPWRILVVVVNDVIGQMAHSQLTTYFSAKYQLITFFWPILSSLLILVSYELSLSYNEYCSVITWIFFT